MNNEKIMEQYHQLKETYKVNHLLNEKNKIIFVLESPHVDELIHQAPVSGLSGKAMSKVIFGENEKTPIGIKLKKETESVIGIMNICSIPMQRTAYSDENVIQMYGDINIKEYETFFDVIEKLRTNTKTTYKEQVKNEMQEIILDDFKKELNKMESKELVIIPCGKTAEAFFEAANIKSDNWAIKVGTPHPSFGNWSKSKYSDKIKEIKKKIRVR